MPETLHNLFRLPLLVVLLLSLTFITACKKEEIPKGDKPLPKDSPTELTIDFKAYFNNELIEFDKMKYITQANDTLSFGRNRMIISNINLELEDGSIIQTDTFALIKFEENYTAFTLNQHNNLPADKTIKKIHFTIGLDSVINHGDPQQWHPNHPLDPLFNHMHWIWASGYIFQVVEGYYMNNGHNQAIFSFHMANLQYNKQISVQLNNPVKLITGEKQNIVIKSDFAGYFTSPNEYSLKTNGANSHSGSPEDLMRMNLLYENLSNVFSQL